MMTQRFFTRFIVGPVLLMTVLLAPVSAADRPTAAQIEDRLRQALAADTHQRWKLTAYQDAELLEFRLIDIEPLSRSDWHAFVDLVIDFGTAPPAVLGYERQRRGPYRLVLALRGERLILKRFTPVGRVHGLPVAD